MRTQSSSLMSRLGILLAALALFTIAGGHWVVLQSVAWGQMLADYSRGASFSTAVNKTFSGKYPCGMCKTIAEARQKEDRKPAALKAEVKTELFAPAPATALRRPAPDHFRYPAPAPESFPPRSDALPQPIPIRALS